MWANAEVAGFRELAAVDNAATGTAVGFYGLDVYSLWESLHRVFDYVRDHRPAAASLHQRAAHHLNRRLRERRHRWIRRHRPILPHRALELLTPDDLCTLFKVRRSWLYDAVESGELPVLRLGRQLRFRRRDVVQYLDALAAAHD